MRVAINHGAYCWLILSEQSFDELISRKLEMFGHFAQNPRDRTYSQWIMPRNRHVVLSALLRR